MPNIYYTKIKPFSDESIFSWITRISNSELLSKPNRLYYKIFKLTRLGPEASHHIVNAIRSDDIDQEAVGQMRYFDGANKFLYRGIPVRRIHLRMHSPQICPACIRDFGYARSFWDLRIATTCHIHKTSLTDTCPGCEKLIRWQRPSLSRCSCSAHLDRLTTPDSVSLVRFNELLYCLQHSPQQPNFSNSVYRIIQMGTIADAINVIEKFGNHFYTGRGPNSNKHDIKPYSAKHPKFFRSLVTLFVNLLEDWPNRFLKFIDENYYSPNSNSVDKANVLKFFKSLPLLASPLSREIEMRLGIYLSNITEVPPTRELSDALIARNFNPVLINVASAAKQLKVKTEHVLNYLDAGLARYISPHKQPSLRSAVYFSEIDKNAFLNCSLTPISEILQDFGISRFVFKQLQKRNQIKQTYFGKKQYTHISSADYKEFLLSLLKNVMRISDPKSYKSLKSILSGKFITESFRVALIEDIQMGKIHIGQFDEPNLIPQVNIYICKKDLEHFRNARTRANMKGKIKT